MDVFVAYTPKDEFQLLSATMEAWAECDGAEVKAIFVKKPSLYELHRRIAADSLSEEKFYILADLGCIPTSPTMVREIRSKLRDEHGLVGLKGMELEYPDPIGPPSDVVVCQKGVVRHWIPNSGSRYHLEHANSVKRSGKNVEVWDEPMFKHVGAS